MKAGADAPRGFVRGPQAVVSGLTLIALAVFAIYLVGDLPQGTLRAMGPAMLPRWLAIGVGLCGAALVVAGLVRQGHQLESYTARGPIMIVIGVFSFAVTIRGFELGAIRIPQLGLIGAGPLAIFIGGFATPEVRWRELLIMAFALTSFCMVLFGDLLNLPIPLYPQWLADLYPADWSHDTRMRVTAGIMMALAVVVFFLAPKHREREPIDVVRDEHAGVV